MRFVKHSELEGRHAAIFTASQPSWLNIDISKAEEIIERKYINSHSKDIGTAVHEWAALHIANRIKLTKFNKNDLIIWLRSKGIPINVIDISDMYDTVVSYVNDCIGFQMEPEIVLSYSQNFFGTTDAISFRNGKLRISDLKTGVTPAHIEQLMVYAALFFLEYSEDIAMECDISNVTVELRLYQSSEVQTEIYSFDQIKEIIDRIVAFDQILYSISTEV